MEALVHFAVGLTGGLLVLLAVDWHPRREFLVMFGSGFWAMVPDGHWLFWGLGLDGISRLWLAFHRSAFADVFWLHRLLDRSETGAPKAELALSVAILSIAIGVYALGNDWNTA